MKKTLTLTIISLLIIQVVSYSQWGWFQLSSGVNNNINDICNHYSDLWAVGDNGLILKSTNGGLNWIPQPIGTNNNLKSINFEFGWWAQHRGIIVGADGTILFTSNSGATWQQMNSGVTVLLNDCVVNRFDSMIVVAVGSNGTIIKSTDGGATWQQKVSNTMASLNSIVQASYDILVAVGWGGIILTSFDFGEYWSQSQSGTSYNINSVIQYTNEYDNLMAAGDNGTLLKSSNGGYEWQAVQSGTTQNLNSLNYIVFDWTPTFIPYIFAAGDNGTLIVSLDNGSTWQNQYVPVTSKLNSVNFENFNIGFIAGNNGVILQTISNHFYIDLKKMDANTISTPFTNGGSFNTNGFEWPKGSGHHARYGSALWLGAIVNGDTLIAASQYSENEYYSGYTDNSGIPHGRNDSNFRVYKMTYGVNDNDRNRWPNSLLGNSDQGAPVYFDSISNSWKPLDFGSQTQFYSFTDSYPESHQNYFCGTTNPLKADVKQLNFALDISGAMGNVIITQFTIINRSNSVWNNAYFTIWTDDDIGNQSNDKIGCDSALSLGYTYNNGSDTAYGSAVPAVGFLLLKGATSFTGNNNDTIYFCKNKTKVSLPGYKDLGMNVFNLSINGDINYSDPDTYNEAYNLMKGLRTSGQPIINPYGGFVTKLFYSGNPVTGTGWNQSTAADVRFYISSGPVNMNPGDTQTIVTAQIIAQGTSSLNSITVLKQYADIVKQYYQSCYTSIPIGIISSSEIVNGFSLNQNYPNPFNPKTVIKFQLPVSSITKLVVYDMLGREIITLVNKELKPGTYKVEFDGSELPSGVYFYKLIADDFTETKKMVLIK